MEGQEAKERAATAQHLPKSVKPSDCVLAPCPECHSTATRFVFQHLCDTKKEDGYVAKVTWEVPAYVCTKGDKKAPYKWKCPVCNDNKNHELVLIKCGGCGRTAKTV